MDLDAPRQNDVAFQASLYDSINPSRRWLHGVRREWVRAALRRHATVRQLACLEVGIGCGIYTPELATLGSVFAIDINPVFVAAVSHLANVEACVGDVLTFAEQERFDLALCSEVIEHLPESAGALGNIFRSLKPGGLLILTTPHSYSTAEIFARLLSFGWVRAVVRKLYGGEPVEDLGHINRLTRRALLRQIRDAGFEVVEQDDCGLYLPIAAEFGGRLGCALAKGLAAVLRVMPGLRQLLWAQCYVLRKPAGARQ